MLNTVRVQVGPRVALLLALMGMVRAVEGQVTPIEAVPFGPQQPVFGPGNDGPTNRPRHPPIGQVPPMPIPLDHEGPATGNSAVLFHDARTNQTVELPAIAPSGAEGGGGGGFDGADGRVIPIELQRSLGAMTAVTSFTAFPERANCKLIMRFTDTTGEGRYFSCSGAMQDAGVILTAGHCVYARDVDGPNIYDWADEIWVYPGWDGLGASESPGSTEVFQAWGWTRGTQYIAGSAWVNDGDFDRDVAAIRVERGAHRMVGMLTGWYGYAWGYGCGDNLARTYYNFSYPAESCATDLHTGRTMYFRSGQFDWPCIGNRLQTWTSPGCLTAVWGGMSGSNAYFFPSAGERWAHAVCSTSDRSSYGRYCKLWEQFANDLNGFRNATRGSVFDIEPLECRLTGSTLVQAGTSTSSIQFVLANATNADPVSAQYTFRVYLSANSTITGNDTLLGTFMFSHDFAPMQTVPVTVNGGVVIPSGTSIGTYWLGVVLDPLTDPIPGNNSTNTWDAQSLTVTPGPPPPPTNDGCSSAANHMVGTTSYGTTANATSDGSATCGVSTGAPDVWYRFVAPLLGTIRLDTCGALYDTVISVHSGVGCPGTTMNQVACNDDHGSTGAGGCSNLRDSALTMSVVGGYSYWVRVAGYQGASGAFALRSAYVPPSNDDCVNAAAYQVGETAWGTLAGASNDGSAFCGQSTAAADAWYRLVAPQSGNLRIDTCGSGFDTVLSVHSGCAGAGQVQLACNDDAPTGTCVGARQSALDVGVTAGNTYLIRVSGYAGELGYFSVRSGYIAPANDACLLATAITPGASTAGVSIGATVDGSASCGSSGSAPDVWYRLVTPCSGRLRIDTCGSTFDTVVSVHSSCPGTTANQIACNDDHASGGAGGCPGLRDSAIEMQVSGGASYWVRVSGFGGAVGTFTLSTTYIAGVPHDSCESAPLVGDGAFVFTNCGAATDGPMEGNCGFGFGDLQVNGDLWVRYDAPSAKRVRVDTCASAPPRFDTKLAVYDSGTVGLPVTCPAADHTAIVCNDDAGSGCGGSLYLSRAVFPAAANSSYLIRVGGYLNGLGMGTLTITSFCPSDVNTDGMVGLQDLFDFLNLWFATNRSADVNGDGGVSLQDIFDFLSTWFAGC